MECLHVGLVRREVRGRGEGRAHHRCLVHARGRRRGARLVVLDRRLVLDEAVRVAEDRARDDARVPREAAHAP